MPEIKSPNVANGEIRLDEDTFSPEIENTFRKSLSYLYGYDRANEKFMLVNVDSNGDFNITLGATTTDTISVTKPTVTSLGVAIVSANSTRVKTIISNTGIADIYISTASDLTVATAFTIPVGESFTIENYIGIIYAITDTDDSNIEVMEVS